MNADKKSPFSKFVFNKVDVKFKENGTPYWRRYASTMFNLYPKTRVVTIVDRNKSTGVTRYNPLDDEILIVPSTSGRWGKSSIVRIGCNCK